MNTRYITLIATIILVTLTPVHALARGPRYRSPSPAKIHAKQRQRFRTDGRCRDPQTKRWHRGCQ